MHLFSESFSERLYQALAHFCALPIGIRLAEAVADLVIRLSTTLAATI
jgi:hypothetical protein